MEHLSPYYLVFIGVILGGFVWFPFGYMIAALMVAASNADDRLEEMEARYAARHN